MKIKNIKKRLWNEVKQKMTDDDFKKLLDLNRERLVQRGILPFTVNSVFLLHIYDNSTLVDDFSLSSACVRFIG
jgi:hypothetical protein